MTKRAAVRRGSTSRTRTRRKGGVLAALRQLWAALFNRPAPPPGGGGSAPPWAGRQRRNRWDDDELERDEYGRWQEQDPDGDQAADQPSESATTSGGNE